MANDNKSTNKDIRDFMRYLELLDKGQLTTMQQSALVELTAALVRKLWMVLYTIESIDYTGERAKAFVPHKIMSKDSEGWTCSCGVSGVTDQAWSTHIRPFGPHVNGIAEDPLVLLLCQQYGFGAVIDSACRQWFNQDSSGAFTSGPCAGLMQLAMDFVTNKADAPSSVRRAFNDEDESDKG